MASDPILRKTEGGINYCVFTLAVNSPKLGRLCDEKTNDVSWPSFEIWGSAAEYLCEHATKGTKLYIEAIYKQYTKVYEQDGQEVKNKIQRFRVINFEILRKSKIEQT